MTKPNHTDTSRSGDLVQNLRDMPVWPMEEAADRIEALEAALRDLVEAVQRRATDLGGYDGRFGLNRTMSKARAALGEKQ